MSKALQQLERRVDRPATPPVGACERELQRSLSLGMREHRTPAELLRMFSDELARWLPHHHVDVEILTPDKRSFFYIGAAFRDPPYFRGQGAALWNGFDTGTRYSLNAFTIRHTVPEATALRFDDYVSDARVAGTNNPSERDTFHGGLAHGLMLPLADDDEVIGMMCCGRGQPHGPFSDREFTFVSEIAQRVAPFVRVFREYRFERERREELERRQDFVERINAFARSVAGAADAHEILTAFACEVLEPQQRTPWEQVAVRLLVDERAPLVRTFVTAGNGGWHHAGEQPVSLTPHRAVLLGEHRRLVEQASSGEQAVVTVALRGPRGIIGSLSLSGAEALTTPAGIDVAQTLADNLAPFLDAARLTRTIGRRPGRSEDAGRHLAQELHDAIVRDLLAAEQALRDEAPGSDRSMLHARDLLCGLHAPDLTAAELATTLEADAYATAEALGATARVAVDVGDEQIDGAQAAALLEVGKQLLANARRHSRAQAIELKLTLTDERCLLRVADDGIGMAPGLREYREAVDDDAVGLFLVRERVRLAGGESRIRSAPNDGTEIEIRVPARVPLQTALGAPATFVAAEPVMVHPRSLDQISVLIVDRHQVMREGLRRLLGRTSEFTVVGEAADGATGVRIALAAKPDAVIVDLPVPQRSGSSAIREILEHAPDTRVLATSAFDDAALAQEALSAGADAFVPMSASADDLLRTLRIICAPPSDSRTATTPRIYLRPRTSAHEERPKLTERELEVLRLITTDLTYREIGARLFISEKTVQYHVSHVFTKLAVRSRAAAVSRAAELGLVRPGESHDAPRG